MKDVKKGFTLIELLVVIAIIGLLSAVVLAALNTARAKGRDAERLSDLREIRNALEEYATANNGNYPSTGASHPFIGMCSGFGSKSNTGATGVVPNLAPTYIAVLPTDPPAPLSPAYSVAGSCYVYASDGNNYMIMAYESSETFPAGKEPIPRPSGGSTEHDFAYYTSGASSW